MSTSYREAELFEAFYILSGTSHHGGMTQSSMLKRFTGRIFLALVFAWSITSPAEGGAQDIFQPNQVLYFSAGWRANIPSPENVLELGIVYRCSDKWCIEYEEFPGKDNFPRIPLPYRHEMTAPYGKASCTDEHVTTIHGVIHRNLSAVMIENEKGFLLRTDEYEFTWERDTSSAGGYILVNARVSDVVLEQPVGYAYESEDLTGRQIRSSELRAYFDGQIAHKNMLMGVSDDWEKKQTSLDLRRFTSSSNAPLLELDLPGLPDVVRKYNKAMMWVHHSVLIPQSSSERLNYIQHEYGHDFNANGCFDEFGHNKLLLPVLHAGLISALVYIEYSPDSRDGVPMISVGRYFRKQ